MKKYYLLITLLVPLYTASGQSTSQKFTLEQCIAYALENNFTLKNSLVDEEIAGAKIKETRGIGLPQINATVGVLHNQKLPRFFGPLSTDTTQFSFFPKVEGAENGDIIAGKNFFQLSTAGDAKLSISQLIFNASYLVGLQAANAYKDLAIKSKDQTKEQLIQNVKKAFYASLINKDRIGLFDSNIARVDSLLRTTTALFENGFAESIDVDRIKVTLNNLRSEQHKFQRLQELSYELLKFQMNFPMNQPIEIVGEISSIKVDASVLNEYSADWDYSQRTDYRLLEANRNLQALNLKNKYAEGLPSLVAIANLGYSTQSPNVSGIFKTNTNINDNGVIGPDKWYSYTNFGLSLNIPLFSGLQRNYRVQQAKLELQKTDNNFLNLKAGIDFEIKREASVYLNAVESVESQLQNRQLAENIARTTRIKFEQGVGSNLEVVEAESALREAQINYYNSLYDAVVAKIDLDKAYGKVITPSEIE
jgi:outer membrane protein